jgi:competence protein ComFA
VKDNSKIIEEFKKGKRKYLVTTSVLERGITIKGLQVLIFHADHKLYTKEALVQIAGRVGRKKEDPTGEVIYYISRINSAISASIEDIKNKNVALQNLLYSN